MVLKKINKEKNKKAVSPMIGYILLISAAILMSVIVYVWLKTYVPKEALECPDSTSLFIKNYTCSLSELNITVRNNGNFNIAGYFIRIANESGQELATVDLSQRLKDQFGGLILRNSILFSSSETGNSFIPNEEGTHVFDISGVSSIYFVELVPTRIQEEDGKTRTASCGDSKIKEEVTC
jgi:hypothetical protein